MYGPPPNITHEQASLQNNTQVGLGPTGPTTKTILCDMTIC
jgi:hypothetical protein